MYNIKYQLNCLSNVRTLFLSITTSILVFLVIAHTYILLTDDDFSLINKSTDQLHDSYDLPGW